jgi:restriction system protein
MGPDRSRQGRSGHALTQNHDDVSIRTRHTVSVPNYQKFMLPILKIAGDRKEHSSGEVIDTVAMQFGLSEQDLGEMLPSGTQAKFPNRVVWAVTYLAKAGLLERTGRGKFRITDRGLKVLNSGSTEIDTKFLKQFSEFLEFQKGNRSSKKEEDNEDEDEDAKRTPFEALEVAYQDLRRALALDVLDRVKRCSPKFFERLVVDLLVAIGYGGSRKDAGQAVGRSSRLRKNSCAVPLLGVDR